MNRLRIVIARVRAWLTRRAGETGLDAEIQAHLDMLSEDYVRSGLSPEDARKAARRAFGGVAQVKEAYQDERRASFVSHVARDVRHGIRGLCRNPGFTFVGILTLALGIAANATIFGLVNALLLRPLPVENADRLTVFARESRDGMTATGLYPAEFEILRTENSQWSNLVAAAPGTFSLVADGLADRVGANFVSQNYWDALGLHPSAGVFFHAIDSTKEAAPPVLVLSYDYWNSRFLGDPAVVGKVVSFGGVRLTIIGVGPRGFHGDSVFADEKVFVPLNIAGFIARNRPARVLGFLKPGISLAQANASLGAISDAIARLRHEAPESGHLRAYWERLSRPIPHTARPEIASTVFFGLLAVFVLALACLNVAGLILIRANARRTEIALRTALGASRLRLALHLFVETSLLATAASVVGLLLGQWMTVAIGRLLPASFTGFARQLGFGFDWKVAAFISTIVGVTTVVVGVLPALHATRTSLEVLHRNGPTVTAGRTPVRRAFMMLQVAGALMLLIVAGLFARSLEMTRVQSFGFDRHHVFDFSMNLSEAGVMGTRALQRSELVLARVVALPGVESAALSQAVPMEENHSSGQIYPDNLDPGIKVLDSVGYTPVSPAYFETLRIPLKAGRAFSTADSASAPRVAIVDEAMAAHYWPNGDAVGSTFRLNSDSAPPIEVVGVVANILNYSTMQDAAMSYFYLPIDQHPTSSVILQLRSERQAASVFHDVATAIHATAPEIVPSSAQTMDEAIDNAVDGLLLPRVGAWLSIVFGLLGLTLAVVGVYGVIAYGASQRTREMALRLALGASPGDIRLDVLKSGMVVVLGGLALGASVAALFSLLTANLYFGVSPLDPATFAGAVVIVGAAALAACYVPARRAMRVDPVIALKEAN